MNHYANEKDCSSEYAGLKYDLNDVRKLTVLIFFTVLVFITVLGFEGAVTAFPEPQSFPLTTKQNQTRGL
ncbi:unnamed protein product [Coregonus sp. 'balchen']|nr:unnamed protein product [Coregonus sp. 'balchen']